MEKPSLYTAIGLMSGTSLDGIDAALIRTDGVNMVERLSFITLPYDAGTREALRACLGLSSDPDGRVDAAAALMTDAHIRAVKTLIQSARMRVEDINLIGFHGQTIFHAPDNRFTWQIGDGARLARETGITVINDFRSRDVAAGGQGAPLIPAYHAALVATLAPTLAPTLDRPVAILNIGGVANVTYIDDDRVLAFDTGPGNALIDDWVHRHTGQACDTDGALAQTGTPDPAILSRLLQHPFFARPIPKSLDRDEWNSNFIAGLSPADGAATLSHFTVLAVEQALSHLPRTPHCWYVTGGGRLNPVLMEGLRTVLKVPVKPVDDLGWDGDALEAEGFAYLAVRSRLGLPISFPETTGVPEPMSGGTAWPTS